MFEQLTEQFAHTSRVWVYGFDKELNEKAIQEVKTRLNNFLASWQHHGKSVKGGFSIAQNRFVIITTGHSVSGCSIDSSVAVFKQINNDLGLNALNPNLIFYENERGVQAVERSAFQQLINDKKVDQETTVYNLMVETVQDIEEGRFRLPLKNSWHLKAFKGI